MTNLKLILRTYSALRQMSPDDIALLETLRALNDSDRELMVETLQGKATARRASKKSSKKSTRASSLGAAVKDGLRRREPTVGGFADDADMLRCSDCGAVSDDNVHHKRTDPNFHPFVPSTTAPPAPALSSANGGVGSTTANSGTQPEDAGTVAHGASGGRVQG